jgi:hypothetical protein
VEEQADSVDIAAVEEAVGTAAAAEAGAVGIAEAERNLEEVVCFALVSI